MSEQNLNELQTRDPSAGTAEDVVEALADGGESSFVVEEKKPLNRSTVVTFVVLVLGAAGVWFMYKRAGPQAASASTNAKETAAAKQTINNFLSGGDASIKLMESMLKNTQRVVQQFVKYPSMTQVPLSDLQTNPFRVRPLTPTAVEDGGAQDRRRREEERQAAMKSVQTLQLQSIMYSDARKGCMINGRLFVEGQQVDGFDVEKINQASVVVKSGPYRFELRMQR
jgi:hypothetical protein